MMDDRQDSGTSPEEPEEFAERARWLIRLRWIAVGCLLAVICLARFIVGPPLALVPLGAGGAALAATNLLYTAYAVRMRRRDREAARARRENVFLNLQTAMDLLLLTYLLFFSGGATNPFILFYVFHMAIAGILLSTRAAYLQATLAVGLFLLLAFTRGLQPPFPLAFGAGPPAGYAKPGSAYLFGQCAAFAATVYITVYLTRCVAGALRRREEELERVVGELQVATSRLERKDREKSQYLRTVSHHIKGSLSSIQSCLRVVLDGLLGPVSEGIRDMVGRAERRSLGLLRYANELLYLSTLRAGNGIRRRSTAAAAVVGRVIDGFTEAAGRCSVELAVADRSGGAEVLIDPFALEELCRQLIDNAVKYSLPGGRVTIRLETDREAGTLALSVVDAGVGISAHDLPHIYDDFFSADIPRNAERTSPGLGLSIVREIVRRHAGTVEVHAEESAGERVGERAGSTFTCTFPLSGKDVFRGEEPHGQAT